MDGDSIERLAYEVAVHDLTEFAHLAHSARRGCGVREGVIMACAAPLPAGLIAASAYALAG